MKFLTQDKLGIVTCNTIFTNEKCEIMGLVSPNTSFLLGKYHSVKECKLIIDEIYKLFDDKTDIIFPMPEHAWQLTSIGKLDIPIGVYNKFHKMGFDTIKDVLDAKVDTLHANPISGVGEKSIKIMLEAIDNYEKSNR